MNTEKNPNPNKQPNERLSNRRRLAAIWLRLGASCLMVSGSVVLSAVAQCSDLSTQQKITPDYPAAMNLDFWNPEH